MSNREVKKDKRGLPINPGSVSDGDASGDIFTHNQPTVGDKGFHPDTTRTNYRVHARFIDENARRNCCIVDTIALLPSEVLELRTYFSTDEDGRFSHVEIGADLPKTLESFKREVKALASGTAVENRPKQT